MSKSPLKPTSNTTTAYPSHPTSIPTSDQPTYNRGRQASLSLARSPLMSPTTSLHPPISPLPGQHSRRGSYAPSTGLGAGKERTSEESVISKRSGEDEEEEGLVRDLEAFDQIDQGEEGRRGSGSRYDGPFQPPVGNEMVGIIASLVGVMVLAVAAGFTTVYDWVL